MKVKWINIDDIYNYRPGDWVYLKLQSYRLKSLDKRDNENVEPISGFGLNWSCAGYKLQLPAESKIHPIFHVSVSHSSSYTYDATRGMGASGETGTYFGYQDSKLQFDRSFGPMARSSSAI